MPDILLPHYCHPSCEPLQSVTRLPRAQAFQAAARLAEREGTAFGRFRDFDRYYQRRMAAEQWLLDSAADIGLQPGCAHPLYAVVQGSEYLSAWFGGATYVCPLPCVPARQISFTLGDSAAQMDRATRRPPFSVQTLDTLVAQHGGDVNALLESLRPNYAYIEAQLWLDSALPLFKRV